MKKKYLLISNKIFTVSLFISLFFQSGVSVLAACSPGEPSCADNNPITKFLNNTINFLMSVGGAVGIFLLVIAAFYFLTARGDNSKIEKARSMILWIIIGMAVVLLAKISINIVTELTK